MAQITQTIDDLDGRPDAATIPFSFDGVSYEIDLCEANAETMRTALSVYVSAARVVGSKKASKKSSSSNSEAAIIREWAANNGYEVGPRGRIPAPIVEAYHDAH